jgi:hypothetical protein
MSKGPGVVEKRIADLFAATRDHALSIDDIAAAAFELRRKQVATRAQRLSATRAAHRVLRRVREMYARLRELREEAHKSAQAALGLAAKPDDWRKDKDYKARLESDPAWLTADKLWEGTRRIGVWRRGWIKIETDHWQAITLKGRLYFHPPDVPVCVWAVSIQAAGIIWAESELIKVTARNVIVRYAGTTARLDRNKLWHWWAWWRGVMFVSSRTGRIAAELDALWQERYGKTTGGVPPSMQMPLATAMAFLGVSADYTRDEVIVAFRRQAKKAHPDAGGTADMFRALVEARDRLLAAIGTSEPAPKMPTYYPSGVRLAYRSGRGSSAARIGSTTPRLG